MANHKIVGAVAVSASLAVGALIGAVLGSPGVTSASTNGPTTTAPAPPSGMPGGGPAGAGQPGPGRGFGGGPELEAAAKAIGITTDELRTQLKDGKTIAEVAKAKGVDRQKVIDAMVAAATKRLEQEKAALPDRMADIVDGKRPQGPGGMGPGGMGGGGMGPGGGHRGFGPGRGMADLSEVAKVLGVTEDDLRTQLHDGKSLADIAKVKGVPVQKVTDTLTAQAKARLAEAVKAGKLTQAQADERLKELTDHLADFVDGTPPMRGPGHP